MAMNDPRHDMAVRNVLGGGDPMAGQMGPDDALVEEPEQTLIVSEIDLPGAAPGDMVELTVLGTVEDIIDGQAVVRVDTVMSNIETPDETGFASPGGPMPQGGDVLI